MTSASILSFMRPSGMYALLMAYISFFSYLHAEESSGAALADAIRNPSACTGSPINKVVADALKTLNQRDDLDELEKIQTVHAACGTYLKTQDPSRYERWFKNTPKHVTEQQWKSVLSDMILEGAVRTLRAIPTLKDLCNFTGDFGRLLEKIAFHDLLKSALCFLCKPEFEKNKDTRARDAVCNANFANAVTSLLKKYECNQIGRFGRSLKALPGYLKLKIAQSCEEQFLGIKPFEDDIIHLNAWKAVTGVTEDEAFSKRYDLIRKYGKSKTLFTVDEEEDDDDED
jgi:hypothetical protein